MSAPTERTCETCGDTTCCDLRKSIPGEGCDLWNPRPAAQDADECNEACDEFMNGMYPEGKPEHHVLASIFWIAGVTWANSRPSRPMSAEVAKAIGLVGVYLTMACHGDHDSGKAIHANHAFDLIVAALKEKV